MNKTTNIILLVAFLFILLFLVARFLILFVEINGNTMSPGLNSGDRKFVSRIILKISRNDLLYYELSPDTCIEGTGCMYIKRVIGLPGEKVEVKANGSVLVNDEELSEPYLNTEQLPFQNQSRPFGPTILKENEFFVMGDNRYYSFDSRHWGPLKRAQIIGKVF